jgi:5-dehydro-2-deoxygluconokinase
MNAAVKRLDVICIGGCRLDLYAQQIGEAEVREFSKYLGGSSGNVAFGTAIQGLKSPCWRALAMTQRPFLRERSSAGGYRYLITR